MNWYSTSNGEYTLLTCQDEDKCSDIGRDIITKALIKKINIKNEIQKYK